MLFNSYTFILAFLPITLGLFFFLGRYAGRRVAISWLVAASLFFYGWWNPAYLGLIIASIFFNYAIGTLLGDERRALSTRQRIFALAVSANLGVLGYYKYANFFLENLNAALGTGYAHAEIILPLGISFFTFTQIAFLVDAYRGEVREYNFLHYALFVTYFPHLIAGPVLHHREMMPQFGRPSIFRFDSLNFAAGLSYFVLGLFKKVVIADSLAGLGAPIFAAAAKGQQLMHLDAWGGALSYTFQLYFDFSGYSDMAIGLALMMGVRLPLNFNSPYKAVNIIEFWRRWHMTLSRFLRDYLYIALGGNKKGPLRRYANLLITMLLGGLWHGAGWTFIIWGALHGCYLIVNHGWHAVRRSLGHDLASSSRLGRLSGNLLTFLAVVVGWVYFRANDVDTAHRILASMLALPQLQLSPFYSAVVQQSALGAWVAVTGVSVSAEAILLAVLSVAVSITFLAPNTQQIMGRFYLAPRGAEESAVLIDNGIWSPNLCWAGLIGLAAVWALLGLTQISEFLYFQF
ncbi:MBOAT family protein [Methylomonas sp. SURF-1]|uniref:Probable alginate O-acetylase n=1 Tax=Methylomonas aurea TaxID=2952224 RepID=A0ABT1UCE6_9GAMM|nr:MBOAT family protein [Methylomonas sp. SURF-1]MCQ8179889.1 MBOAT family protein [Methylomonas sp. SURF-1]